MQPDTHIEQGISGKVRHYVEQALSPLGRAEDLDPLIERVGDARYVLLGEASHGTSDYYTWRARITARLIREKGFTVIGVEGDWPDCSAVNSWLRAQMPGENPRRILGNFRRWPTWMWANWQVAALCNLLRRHNDALPVQDRVGFYGLDVYSLWESMHAVIGYLEQHAPESLEAARKAYRRFEPFGGDVQAYAHHTLMVPENCEDEVVRLLAGIRGNAHASAGDGEAAFSALQNALVMKSAERSYRAMVRGEDTWNLRDHHMTDTLDRLMGFHGPRSKAIVWAHNSHIGDARATSMAGAGLVNIGQLVRERHEDEGVVLVGFASCRGSVIAGRGWGRPMERMAVPPARAGSWEEVLHGSAAGDRLLLTGGLPESPDFLDPRPHRAIGVVYQPREERLVNYVPTVLPRRYDALLFLDASEAVHPLQVAPEEELKPPATYPWGL